MKRILFIFARMILLIIVAVFATDMNRMDQRLPSAHAESLSFLDEPMRPAHVYEYPAPVEAIEIIVHQYPLQVLIIARGCCIGDCDTLEHTQSRAGFAFSVSLTIWPPSCGGCGCTAGTHEFQEWIDLDLVGADPGNYTVDVNGTAGTFILPEPVTPTPTVTGTPPTATPTSIPTNTPTFTATPTPTVTPVPDFTLSVSPTSRSVSRGGTTTYTINLAANSSYGGSVSLAMSVSGLPNRLDYSFNPNPVTLTPGSNGSSVLTITTRNSTPSGTYTLTIRGTDGVRTRSQTVTLIVIR